MQIVFIMSSSEIVDIHASPAFFQTVEDVLETLNPNQRWGAEQIDPEILLFTANAVEELVPTEPNSPRISREANDGWGSVAPKSPLHTVVFDSVITTILTQKQVGVFDEDKTLDEKLDGLQGMLLFDFFDNQHQYRSHLNPVATVATNFVLSHARGMDMMDFLKAGNFKCYGNEGYMSAWYRQYFKALDSLSSITLSDGSLLTYGITTDSAAACLMEAGQYETIATYLRSLVELEEGEQLFDSRNTKRCLLQGDCINLGFNTRGAEPRERRLFTPIEVTAEELLGIARACKGQLGGASFSELKSILQLDSVFEALDSKERQNLFQALLESDPAFGFALYAKYRKGIMQVYEIFGANATTDAHDLVEQIISGELTEFHSMLGITLKGKRGLEQLKSNIHSFVSDLLAPDKSDEDIRMIFEKINRSTIYEALARAALNYDHTQWKRDSYGSTEFKDIFVNLLTGRYGTERPAIPDAIIESPVFQLQTYEKTQAKEVAVPPHELLNVLFDLQDVTGEFDALKQKYFAYNDLKKLIGDATSQPDAHEMRKDLMRTMIMIAYDANSEATVDYGLQRELASIFVPGYLESIENLLEVVGHRIIDEGLALNEEQKEALKKALKLDTFETYLESVGNGTHYVPKGKVREIKLVPSKDIGFEFAGDIGDACYTRVANAGVRFPNMTAVLLNDVTEGQQKLVGSMILIEATDKSSGRKTLIMRALNPRETWLKKHKESELLDVFIGYSKEAAEKMDAQLAIVIDQPTGASTNRRTLFKAMGRYKRGSPLQLDPQEVRFNGYSLEDSVYVIPNLSVNKENSRQVG